MKGLNYGGLRPCFQFASISTAIKPPRPVKLRRKDGTGGFPRRFRRIRHVDNGNILFFRFGCVCNASVFNIILRKVNYDYANDAVLCFGSSSACEHGSGQDANAAKQMKRDVGTWNVVI